MRLSMRAVLAVVSGSLVLLPRSACGVGSQKFNIFGNRPLDPLGLDVGVFMIAVFEHRALPFDFPGGWRWGQ